MTDQKTIGFIGIGVMGASMAARLLASGYRVYVYNRTKSKAEGVLEQGAQWKDTVAEVAAASDIVITMIGYPKDVETVYFDEDGVLQNANSGSYLIDMTTSKPALAEEIAAEAGSRDMAALDAPVSGGDIGARNGALTIMVGGGEKAYNQVKPIFDIMGENVVRQGEAGAGQHTKMANQVAIASNMMGVCEAVVYAEKAGLDPKRVLDSIGTGAAGSFSLSHLAPRMIEGDFAPGFYIKHFIKDMTIALEAAEDMGLMTPGLKQAKQLYDQLAEQGKGDKGTQALYQLYQ